MPPVGCEFEMAYYLSNDWKKCVLIAHGEEQIIFKYDGEREFSGHRSNYQFRPLTIRSETDKKRDEAGEAIYRAINWNHEGDIDRNSRFEDYCKAYDAIVAGKIPGVRIE